MENGWMDYFATSQYMPHGHCYLWQPGLVWVMVITDTLIGLAYVSISLSLYSLVKKINLPFTPMFLAFGLFIGACGMTHFMEVYNLWVPNYWLAALIKVVTAAASVATALLMFPVRPKIAAVSESAKLSESRRQNLETLTNELERKVEERTADLQKAVEARNEFLSIASHELRTPLTPILMQLQMTQRLVQRAPKDGDNVILDAHSLNNTLEMTLKHVSLMSSLVDNLLDVSRIESKQMKLSIESLDVVKIVETVASRFREQFKKSNRVLEFKSSDESIWCECDGVRIDQVVTNLLSNTLKYGNGKPVKVTLSREGNCADWVKIAVEDQGVGISPDLIDRVFDRFERAGADKNISGLGLGLYISKQIILAHKGKLSVESKLNEGSTFFIRLPLIAKSTLSKPEKIS